MNKAHLSTKRVIRAMVISVLLPLIFVVAFITPSHTLAANGLPIAVAGSPAAVQPLLKSLGDVRVVRVSSARPGGTEVALVGVALAAGAATVGVLEAYGRSP
jgi:hypothetical protein